jgi:hypothetical protein
MNRFDQLQDSHDLTYSAACCGRLRHPRWSNAPHSGKSRLGSGTGLGSLASDESLNLRLGRNATGSVYAHILAWDQRVMKTRFKRLLTLVLLLTFSAVLQAQFTFTTNNGAITITGCPGCGCDVTIPGSTNGYPVTSIGASAFANQGLTSVTIGANVISIGGYAFASCSSLTSVTIPSSVTAIEDDTFWCCSSLTNVTIPRSVTDIGSAAFCGCSSLASIAIPNSVTNIGADAFSCCTVLTKVTMGNSLTSIATGAFYNCPSMSDVYFQGNAPSLGSDVFGYDNNPTAYYLPGTTGWSVFSTNTGLTALLWNPQMQPGDTGFGIRTNHFGFNITGTSNLIIVVEGCTNLAQPVWSPVATNTLTGSAFYFSDARWTNYPSRFYRLRSP